jgi:hypothetical protein
MHTERVRSEVDALTSDVARVRIAFVNVYFVRHRETRVHEHP